MPKSDVSQEELERVNVLHATGLLDSDANPAFDALVRLAARVSGSPMAAINLIDLHRVWALSRNDSALPRQATRNQTLCATVVSGRQPLVLTDARAEPAYQALPIVSNAPFVRGYVALPLRVEGHVLGVLSVLDATPRAWSETELASLHDIATTVTTLMAAQLATQRHHLMDERVRGASLAGSDWLWETDADGTLQWASAGLQQHTGINPLEEIGLRGIQLYHPREDETRASWDRYLRARERREPFSDLIADRLTPRGPITASISGCPFFGPDGRFLGYRGATRIITRQLKLEQEARRADQLLRQAIESFQISVMITDPQDRIILANRYWHEQSGAPAEADLPAWSSVLRRLIAEGVYPDAAGREEAFLAWRLDLSSSEHPVEMRFRDRWLLLKDHILPDGCVAHIALDITDAKESAERLEANQKVLASTQARLQAVLHALPDLWFVIDPEGRHVDGHANHPMLMQPVEALQGKMLGDNLPLKQAHLQQEAWAKVRATGQAQRLEYDLYTTTGTRRYFEAQLTPMPEDFTLFVSRDITERQVAAEKLRVSEELYRSVAATISDGLVIVELNGRVVAMNPAASRILGVRPEQVQELQSPSLLGLTFLQDDLITPLPLTDWPIAETLARGERIVDRVNALRRPDGELAWIQTSCHLLRVSPEAPPFAAMATLRDITRERQAQRDLQISEERWKFALEGAGDAVWDWDVDSDKVYFSPRLRAMLGFTEGEFPDSGQAFLAHLCPDDLPHLKASIAQYLSHGQGIYECEYRMRHRDGREIVILSRGKLVTPRPGSRSRRMVGTQSDITRVKQAEMALRDKQAAEAASAAKTEFLSRMSHEVRTPLNAVSGFAQLLQRHMQAGVPDPTALAYVQQIQAASHHLMGLVNDVLDLQQVESGNLHVRLEALSLQDELDPCLAMLAPMASQRGITLRCDVHVNWLIQADRQRLRQIIMNVGSNAIKYNREGGIVRIDAVLHASDMVALTFEDTGPGMTPRELTRLFQPFERLGKETSSIEGTGLGLIITRSLIEAMGGTMTIHSQPGAGTRVHLTFAKADDAGDNLIQSDINAANPPQGLDDGRSSDSTMPLSETHSAARHAPATPLRVLYVEDNRINAMLFEEALRPYPQIELEVAEDGQMAMSLAQERAPDVLVLDAHLPGMSGFEVFDALRALPGLNDVPAFMCSADAMPEDVARARDAGFAGYWTKPIDIVAVTDELCRLAARGDNAAP